MQQPTLKALIESDYVRYTGGKTGGVKTWLGILFEVLTAHNHCFAYSFWLRVASRPGPLRLIGKAKHYLLSRRYGIQIPYCTQIGEGLYIGHGVGIVVNGGTKIGSNCNISQFLSIGTNHGTPATIGDNVYIGPHVSIVEDVRIGDGAKIGAGCVVISDVPAGCTAVGVPNRNIQKRDN